VGAAALPNDLPLLARAAARRTTALNVLLCENLRDAAQLARTRMTELCPHGVVTPAFIATSIGKMVPLMPESVRAKDPLVVWAEAYNQIIADADAFVGIPPAVPGLVLKHNFDAYVDCKLFVHNLGHAAAAYFGFLAGKTHIWECMADASVRMPVERVMHEAGRALLWRYSQELTADALAGHIEDLLRRFENRALGDSVFRVGRDLPRKLAPGDRCIGALRLIQSAGGDIDAVCAVIAAALRFAARDEHGEPFAADTAVRMRVAEDGVADVLTTVCGLAAERDADVIARISAAYTNMPDRATPATDRQPQATADGAGSV
jgi:mannitol-1-phosphate 5-dehydrogenase